MNHHWIQNLPDIWHSEPQHLLDQVTMTTPTIWKMPTVMTLTWKTPMAMMFLRDPLCEVPRLTETCLVRLVMILTLLILGMVYRMPENKTQWRMFHAMFYYDSNNSNSSKRTLFLNKHVVQTRLAYLGWGLLSDTLGSFSKPRQWERHQTKGLISSENNSSVCGFWDFVRFFAVLCKTTTWNDKVYIFWRMCTTMANFRVFLLNWALPLHI